MTEIRLGAAPYGLYAAAVRERAVPLVRRFGVVPTVAILVYLLLTITGATTSSIGIARLRAEPASPHGIQFGPSRGVHSDEWLTSTPMDLGRLAVGTDRADSPLATPPDLTYQLPNGSPVEMLIFFDGDLFNLGGVLPQSWLFAAWWWLPTLLLVLALPPWLRRLGATPHLAWLATGLTVFAPAAAWWSLYPIRVLGFAVVGSYLLILAADRVLAGKRRSGIALAAVAGMLFARLPTFCVPWSITIGVPVILATAAWLLWPAAIRRAGWIVVACAGGVTLVLVGWLFLENHATLASALDPVYPGLRRSTGQAVSAARRFGAPLLGIFQRGPGASINLSELSSGYTVAAAWALVVWIGTTRRGWGRERAASAVLAGFTALWLVWCTLPLGGFGRALPVVNRVTPVRAAQTVGFLAVLVLALVLSRVVGLVRTRVAAAAGGVCALVTLYGAVEMRSVATRLNWAYIVLALVAVGFLVFVVTWFRDRNWPVVLCVVVAALQVLWVNPVIFGFGDLRAGNAAHFASRVGKDAHERDGYWATDDLMVDALFIANGVPLLSGRQVTGPVTRQWSKLDPTGHYRRAWNRGTSYLEFRWSTDARPVIIHVGADQIVIRVDPCAMPSLGFPLVGIVSARQQTQSCLALIRTVQWSGKTRYAYRVDPAAAQFAAQVRALPRSAPPGASRSRGHSSRPARAH